MGTTSSSFKAFLTVTDLINRFDRADLPVTLSWTAWMDPGVHTGFAMMVYATSENDIGGESDLQKVNRHYDALMKKIGICGWRGEAGAPAGGAPDLCSAAILAIHTELLTDHEPQQVRTAIARVRQLGSVFTGSSEWNLCLGQADEYGWVDPHLGEAGIGAERFINLRPERDAPYLSPVRIRSMFQYALEDEFGVEMLGQMPGDAKNTFTDDRLKAVDLYVPGPDHIRDAMRHALLSIRKNG